VAPCVCCGQGVSLPVRLFVLADLVLKIGKIVGLARLGAKRRIVYTSSAAVAAGAGGLHARVPSRCFVVTHQVALPMCYDTVLFLACPTPPVASTCVAHSSQSPWRHPAFQRVAMLL